MNTLNQNLQTLTIQTGIEPGITKGLHQLLFQFINDHYEPISFAKFREILQPKIGGYLILIYNQKQHLLGFTRIRQYLINHAGNRIQTFIAQTYRQPVSHLDPTLARVTLSEIIKYKLTNPYAQLMYFSCISSLKKYVFLQQLNQTIYPNHTEREPDEVMAVAERLKTKSRLTSSMRHPLIVTGMPMSKCIEPHSCELLQNTKILSRFLPHEAEGEALLVYIPLTLAAMGHSITQLLNKFPKGIAA